jgi:hypothetical protein
MENLAPHSDPALLASFSAHLAKLKACAGEACRELEDVPVEPQLVASGEPAATAVTAASDAALPAGTAAAPVINVDGAAQTQTVTN